MLRRLPYILVLIVLGTSWNLIAQRSRPAPPAPMVDDQYGSASEIEGLSAGQLVKILEDSKASVYAKAKACQQLAVKGDKSAVPALAMLLENPKLSHYARFGLEPIEDPAVDRALRKALNQVKGKLLIGVINSIGRRRDSQALEALSKLMHEGDSEVAEAAATALGRIRPAF